MSNDSLARSAKQRIPAAIYVWLVPSEEMLDQPGNWRIRKWDTEPFPEANFVASQSEPMYKSPLAALGGPQESEGYPGIAHDYETLRHALLNIASYQGRGPLTADWQGMVRSLGQQARDALKATEHRTASAPSSIEAPKSHRRHDDPPGQIRTHLRTPSATERREGAIEGISLYLGTFEEKGDHSPGARVRMAMEEFDKIHSTDRTTETK